MHNVENTAPWLYGLPLLPASRVISDLIIWRRQAGDPPGPLSILRKSLNRWGDDGIVRPDLFLAIIAHLEALFTFGAQLKHAPRTRAIKSAQVMSTSTKLELIGNRCGELF